MLTLPFGLQAQNTEKMPISVSYFGNLGIHPGTKISLYKDLVQINKTKKNGNLIMKSLTVVPSISLYNHAKSRTGLILGSDLSWIRTGKWNFFIGPSLGLNYYGMFNSGDTWVVEGGIASQKGNSVRGYFAPSFSYTYGKNIKNIGIYTRLNSHFLMGYNSTTLPELSLELGVKFTPSFSLNKGKIKEINKTR